MVEDESVDGDTIINGAPRRNSQEFIQALAPTYAWGVHSPATTDVGTMIGSNG